MLTIIVCWIQFLSLSKQTPPILFCTAMSLKQVNSLVLSVSDYLCFDHIARYQLYLQMIGNQQKSVFWRTLDVIGRISFSRIDR